MSSKKLIFDKVRAHLERVPDSMADIEAKVGYHEGVQYPDIDGKKGVPVAYVATIMEYGAPGQNIPARPTMGPTVRKNKKAYVDLLARGTKQVLAGKMNGEEAIDIVGQQCAGDIRKTISTLTSPALKPATIKARLRRYASKGQGVTDSLEKPLVDTGIMLNSCTSEVGKK